MSVSLHQCGSMDTLPHAFNCLSLMSTLAWDLPIFCCSSLTVLPSVNTAFHALFLPLAVMQKMLQVNDDEELQTSVAQASTQHENHIALFAAGSSLLFLLLGFLLLSVAPSKVSHFWQ